MTDQQKLKQKDRLIYRNYCRKADLTAFVSTEKHPLVAEKVQGDITDKI